MDLIGSGKLAHLEDLEGLGMCKCGPSVRMSFLITLGQMLCQMFKVLNEAILDSRLFHQEVFLSLQILHTAGALSIHLP